jgi:hypothetical protein
VEQNKKQPNEIIIRERGGSKLVKADKSTTKDHALE